MGELLRAMVLLGALALVCGVPVQAQEPWGNDPAHNMVIEAENVPAQLDEAHERWTVETGTKWQLPMPTVVGDKVLIGSHARAIVDEDWRPYVRGGAVMTCRNMDDGSLVWQAYVAKKGYGLSTYGICGTPVVEDDRIYVMAMDEVLCLDMDGLADGNDGFQQELALMTKAGYRVPEGEEPHTELPDWAGDVIWRFNVGERWPAYSVQDATSASPVLIGNQLWVSTAHQLGSEARGHHWKHGRPGYAPHLVVLDTESGQLLAHDEMDVPIVFHGEWSSPSRVEVNGTPVVVFPDGYGVLHGFAVPDLSEATAPVVLQELWSFDCNLPEWRMRDGKRMPYTEDKRLFFKYPEGYPDSEEWYHHPDRKRHHFQRWGPAEVIARPAVVGNRIFLGVGRDAYYNVRRPAEGEENLPGRRYYGQGRFMCLEMVEPDEPPRLVWEDLTVSRTQCTASIADGLVYIADMRGFLHCLDGATGEACWRQDLGSLVECSSQLVTDGKVYVAEYHGKLMAFTAGREQPELLSKREYKSWVSTVYPVDGALVVSTLRRVTVFENKDE